MNNVIDTIGLVLQDGFWSALAALGFAILFNVPRRYLLACLACAAVGHGFRTLLIHFGIQIEFATLFAAGIVGFMSVALASRMQTPSVLFSVPGIIPMIPGSFAYRAMLGLVSLTSAAPDQTGELLNQAMGNFIRTGLILGALGIGIAAPVLLFQRDKPVV
jgi:uncharacterized membrane protein YjjB (DUF3815 family)